MSAVMENNLIRITESEVQVAVKGENQFNPLQTWIEEFSEAQGWSNQQKSMRLLGDINGDSLMDLIGVRNGELFVAVSAGDGFAPVELSEVQIDTNDFPKPTYLSY